MKLTFIMVKLCDENRRLRPKIGEKMEIKIDKLNDENGLTIS